MGLFSSGSLELQLDQTSTTPGGQLTGRVAVEVKEDTPGCSLSVELIGRSRMRRSVFAKKKTNPWKTFLKEEITLFEDQTVQAGSSTHAFTMPVSDENALVHLNAPEGVLGDMVETFLENMVDRIEYRWQLHARLVVPGLFNDLKDDCAVEVVMPEDRVR